MKKALATALAVGVMAVGATAVEARDGCGRGMYRGPAGHCRVIRGGGGVVVLPGRLVIGNFYAGRGYWDGHRYWQHRHRHHNGWRYR